MADTLFADVSEWQPVVDDSYPYRWLSIRSNDGTYPDRHFRANWNTARRWLDSGRLRGLIVYCVYRPNWHDTLATHIDLQAESRPDVVSMVDVETWDGQIRGDNSTAINRLVWGISDWRAPRFDDGPRRVIGYLNPHDAPIWPNRPSIGFVVPSYGAYPMFGPDTHDLRVQMIAHQYTDGDGYGHGLPEGYDTVRCDMNAANGYDAEQFRVATGITPADTSPLPPGTPRRRSRGRTTTAE